jgi:hypothetical protein
MAMGRRVLARVRILSQAPGLPSSSQLPELSLLLGRQRPVNGLVVELSLTGRDAEDVVESGTDALQPSTGFCDTIRHMPISDKQSPGDAGAIQRLLRGSTDINKTTATVGVGTATVQRVRAEMGPFESGGGLNLHVDRNGNASWCFRFTSPVSKRERSMGLGPLADVPLAKAREAARAARNLLQQNIDPIEQRNAQRAAARVNEQRGVTFRAYAALCRSPEAICST